MEIKQAKLLLLLFTFVAVCLQAQDVENAEPLSVAADRPGMAKGVGVLPFKTIQWETGFCGGQYPFRTLCYQYDGQQQSR